MTDALQEITVEMSLVKMLLRAVLKEANGSNALLMVCGISVARQVVVAHETVPRTAGYRVVLACRIPMVVLL